MTEYRGARQVRFWWHLRRARWAVPPDPGLVGSLDAMSNPWLRRRVLNYAHQGGAKEAPSSTMHAFRTAVANGADALEMDVHATADGELVVCHDATLDRTTEGTGRIADHPLPQLRKLDNAHWFVAGHESTFTAEPEEYVLRGRARRDPSFGIATVREVLEEFPNVFLNFDIKETVPVVDGYEAALAALLKEFGRTDDVLVASFHDVALERFRAAGPAIHTVLGLAATTALWQWVNQGAAKPTILPSEKAVQPPDRFGPLQVTNERFVEAAHELGLAVHVWTIDEPEPMAEQLAYGVDGVITNCPRLLRQVLQATRS